MTLDMAFEIPSPQRYQNPQTRVHEAPLVITLYEIFFQIQTKRLEGNEEPPKRRYYSKPVVDRPVCSL